VLAGVDEVEPLHLAHDQEDRVDRLADRFGNYPGEPTGELAELGLGAACSDVALDDRHGSLLPAAHEPAIQFVGAFGGGSTSKYHFATYWKTLDGYRAHAPRGGYQASAVK
jgi:hypothetical protein